MGFHATINGRPAPRVRVTARVTGSEQQRKAAELAGPVTVTKFTPGTVPAPSVAERRAGALSYGVTTSGTRNQPRDWRVVRSPEGAFIRAEYRVKGGLVTVRKVSTQGFNGWMGFLTTGGKIQPVAVITRDTAIEPHRIQDECRRIALRNAAQIGHGELG